MTTPEQQPRPLAQAEVNYRRALELAPTSLSALRGLAAVCHQTGRDGEAETLLRRVAELEPASAEPRAALAVVFGGQRRHDEAAQILRDAVRLGPGNALAHNNLGVALENTGKPPEAIEAYRRAIALRPGYAEAHNHLGNALRALGRLAEAEAAHREAIRIKPEYAQAYNNLAATLTGLGQAEDVVACLRKLAELRPGSSAAGSDLLLALHYVDGVAPQSVFQEHLKWADGHAKPLSAAARSHDEPDGGRDPSRRLRVGYVSPDFRDYPAARFFEPLLAGHDRAKFEVFCYSDVGMPDAITARLRAYDTAWRDIAGLPDEHVEQLIRQDRIDILVDLAGHTVNPRLLLFARRPAPVQASYIGYPDTTGMETMDYRITDDWHDPFDAAQRTPIDSAPGGAPGMTDAFHTERLIRLPRCCWSYMPGDYLPAVGRLPAQSPGSITFGVMNRLVKVTPRMIGLWARVLAAVPGSRLMVLVARGVEREPSVRERFVEAGIDARRLLLVPQRPRTEYLELFNRVDLGLDTFPYAGMTTTCDALWMGVPTITLAGQTHVSRTGVSLLSAVGLPELIARTPDEYVEIAARLAADPPRLAALRSGLRERMRQSPLCDGARLAREVEAAYRGMWKNWCNGGSR